MPRGKQIDCAMQSPIYRQILKEVAKGYSFEQCNKTNKIIRVKKWNILTKPEQLKKKLIKESL